MSAVAGWEIDTKSGTRADAAEKQILIPALATLGLVYGLAGMRDEAISALERMIALSKERYVSPFQLAWFYVGLGEKDQALDNFEKAYTDRDSMMPYLRTFPLFDSMRSEPRYKALLKKMGLE